MNNIYIKFWEWGLKQCVAQKSINPHKNIELQPNLGIDNCLKLKTILKLPPL